MPFDIDDARKYYSDKEIEDHLRSQYPNFDFDAAKQHYSLGEIASHLTTPKGGEQTNATQEQVRNQPEAQLDSNAQRQAKEQGSHGDSEGVHAAGQQGEHVLQPVNAGEGKVKDEETTKQSANGTQGSQAGQGVPEQADARDKEKVGEAKGVQPSFAVTKLSPEQEEGFREWKYKNAPKDSGEDYDLRGAYLDNLSRSGENDHLDDKYKLPNHPTFSTGSKYSNRAHPGGVWGRDESGRDTFTPSAWMMKDADRIDRLKEYMKEKEPNAKLIIPQPSFADKAKEAGMSLYKGLGKVSADVGQFELDLEKRGNPIILAADDAEKAFGPNPFSENVKKNYVERREEFQKELTAGSTLTPQEAKNPINQFVFGTGKMIGDLSLALLSGGGSSEAQAGKALASTPIWKSLADTSMHGIKAFAAPSLVSANAKIDEEKKSGASDQEALASGMKTLIESEAGAALPVQVSSGLDNVFLRGASRILQATPLAAAQSDLATAAHNAMVKDDQKEPTISGSIVSGDFEEAGRQLATAAPMALIGALGANTSKIKESNLPETGAALEQSEKITVPKEEPTPTTDETEKQKQGAGGIPPVEGEPSIQPTEEQAQVGTTPGVGESKKEKLEPIVAAAYKAPSGETYTGANHSEALRNALNSGDISQEYFDQHHGEENAPNRESPEYGFLDRNLDFKSREESEKAADANGQLDKKSGRPVLHSQDITGMVQGEHSLDPESEKMIEEVGDREKEKIKAGEEQGGDQSTRYSMVGASIILKTLRDSRTLIDLGTFAREMEKELGEGMGSDIPEIFENSKKVINQFQTATQPRGKMERLLASDKENNSGPSKKSIKEMKPVVADLKKKIAESFDKSEMFSEYLKGMEKGSKIGSEAGKKEMVQKYRIADKALSTDQEIIRRGLVDLVNDVLPLAERGRFIGAITRAMKRPSIQSGDPLTWYKNAATLSLKIESRANEVYKTELVKDISSTAKKAMASPSVDLKYKRVMQNMLSDFTTKNFRESTIGKLNATREYLKREEENGANVYIPQSILNSIEQVGKTKLSDLPTASLESLSTKINLLERLGRMNFKNRKESYDGELKIRTKDMMDGPGKPLEAHEQFKPQPGEGLSFKEKFGNWYNRQLNKYQVLKIGHAPEDVIFDRMQDSKGTYHGPLFDHVRTPVDAAHDAVHRATSEALQPLAEIVKKNKLSDKDEDLIGLWAQIQQDGGEEAALSSGVKKSTIDKLKSSGLSKGQEEAYSYMRNHLDAMLPKIQQTAHDLYNIEVTSVKNYFPWMREYEKFDLGKVVNDPATGKEISEQELQSLGSFIGDFHPKNTSKTPQGFLISRKEGASPSIRYDAFDVFKRHVYNANRLTEGQYTYRMVSDLINTEEFGNKFGKYGQSLMKDWLTQVVTDGRGGNVTRWEMVDSLSRAASRGLVFFNMVSNVKHISAVPQGISMAGGSRYYWKGLKLQHTEEGSEFIKKFPQVAQRGVGELSFAEVQKYMIKNPDGIFQKGMDIGNKYGFMVGQTIDENNSRAVFIGRYLSNLKEKGKAETLSGPIDQDAAYNAMVWMRRTVSSNLAKDIQPAIGRGMGFGGNVSWARALNAFRQFALERASIIAYDIPMAFKRGNPIAGLGLIGSVALASLYETQLPGAVKAVGHLIAGGPKDKNDEKHHESWWGMMIKDTITLVPYANIAYGMASGKSGIPIVDIPRQGMQSLSKAFTSKTREGRKEGVIGAATAAAEFGGITGASVFGSIAKKSLVDQKKKKIESKISSRKSREESKRKKYYGTK